MKLNELLSPWKIFLDMDGVFVDWVSGVETITGLPFDKSSDDEKFNAIEKEMEAGREWWLHLTKLPQADKLFNYIKSTDIDFIFLSSAGNRKTQEVAKQKQKWIRKNFGNYKLITVKTSSEKAQYAKANHILIDDRKKSIEPWKQAGGIGILHKNVPDTIRQLKELINDKS